MKNIVELKRSFRHKRIRKVVAGTDHRLRLCLHRSLKNLSAQIVNDQSGKILLTKTTQAKDLKSKFKSGGNIQSAEALGEAVAKEAISKGIKKIVFDRGGYLYHGRVKAFAESARKAGLEF